MKRLTFVSTFFLILFLPLSAWADGKNKTQKRTATNCNKLKGKAKKACLDRQAAAAAALAKRRAEEARRRAIAYQMSLQKITADNIQKDDVDGEDLAVRKAAIEALGDNPGAVVVTESQTGKVLAAVNQDWVYRKSFQPCSTIKLVTAVAGLHKDSVPTDDEESIEEANDLEFNLAKSRNPYFQQVGLKIDYPEFIGAARKLGLGRPTGVNVYGESPGKIPMVRKTALVFSHGYGFEITPIQQAQMVSAITTGKLVTPFVPKQKTKAPSVSPRIELVNIPAEDLQRVIPGMVAAATYGTASRGVNASRGIAGKTGTCSATGTFVSVAPITNPQYTVVVVLRGNTGKGRYAAAVAGRVYEALLTRSENNLASTVPTPVKPDIVQ